MARNLIKNPCGEEGLEYWEDIQNGGDGWNVETLPGACGADIPCDGVSKYFASSFESCSKTQVIDLLHEGFAEEVLDSQPNIVVSDWRAARTDSKSGIYELKVQLLSGSREVIKEYYSESITIPEDTDGAWTQLTYTFSEYGPGVRYIQFTHCGQDTVYWKGWYGVRVTNSSVTIEV